MLTARTLLAFAALTLASSALASACTSNLVPQKSAPPLTGQIVFQAQAADGNTHLFFYDFSLPGTRRVQLDANWGLCYAVNPSFSPDGTWITFTGKRGATATCSSMYRQVYAYKLNSGTQPANVFQGNAINQEDPKFSADGNSIVFKNNGNIAIAPVTLNADGSVTAGGMMPITDDTTEHSGPSLTPTAKYVYYFNGGGTTATSLWRRELSSGATKPMSKGAYAYYPVARDLSSLIYVRPAGSGTNDQLYVQLPDERPGVEIPLAFSDCTVNNSDPASADEDMIIFSRPNPAGQAGSNYELYAGRLGTAQIWSLSALAGLNADHALSSLLGSSYHARQATPKALPPD